MVGTDNNPRTRRLPGAFQANSWWSNIIRVGRPRRDKSNSKCRVWAAWRICVSFADGICQQVIDHRLGAKTEPLLTMNIDIATHTCQAARATRGRRPRSLQPRPEHRHSSHPGSDQLFFEFNALFISLNDEADAFHQITFEPAYLNQAVKHIIQGATLGGTATITGSGIEPPSRAAA